MIIIGTGRDWITVSPGTRPGQSLGHGGKGESGRHGRVHDSVRASSSMARSGLVWIRGWSNGGVSSFCTQCSISVVHDDGKSNSLPLPCSAMFFLFLFPFPFPFRPYFVSFFVQFLVRLLSSVIHDQIVKRPNDQRKIKPPSHPSSKSEIRTSADRPPSHHTRPVILILLILLILHAFPDPHVGFQKRGHA